MNYLEKNVTLKDGTIAVFRSPKPGEGEVYLDFLKGLCAESEYVMNYPEEITFTPEDEENWIKSCIEDPNRVDISCFIDGKLAGNCGVRRLNKMKTRHRAVLDIGIRKAYWNKGLGTALFKELLAIAKDWGVSQIYLEMDSQNDRARHLYEKMGFKEVAAVPQALLHKDGSYSALVTMIYQE